MQSLVVPKNRRPKFNLTFSIIDLNNIPYVSGKIYVKWNLPSSASGVSSSSSSSSSSSTDKVPIKDHRAELDCTVTAPIRMVVDKRNMLQDVMLELEVLHDIPAPLSLHTHGQPHVGKDERSKMGSVRINLAEYVKETRMLGDKDPGGVTRRHLLQDSKVNCTLKVMIDLKQIEGDDKFDAPSLRHDPGFSGITGLMRDVNDEADELPTISKTNRTQTTDDLNEVYRQTLAAELLREPGLPSADEVIEDIFAGGDGWAKYKEQQPQRKSNVQEDGAGSDGEAKHIILHSNKRSWPDFGGSSHTGSNFTGRRLFGEHGHGTLSRNDQHNYTASWQAQQHGSHHNASHMLRRNSSRGSFGKNDDPFRIGGLRSRGSFAQSSHDGDGADGWVGQAPEVDEFDVREDLRCWNSKRDD